MSFDLGWIGELLVRFKGMGKKENRKNGTWAKNLPFLFSLFLFFFLEERGLHK